MGQMFQSAKAFNSDLAWDTSKLTGLSSTFRLAEAFNAPLVWDTSKVTNMQSTLDGTGAFNQPLAWDTSKVTAMRGTFGFAKTFDQPLAWDTSKVTNMGWAFSGAGAFNQQLVCARYEQGDDDVKDLRRHRVLQPAARLGHELGDQLGTNGDRPLPPPPPPPPISSLSLSSRLPNAQFGGPSDPSAATCANLQQGDADEVDEPGGCSCVSCADGDCSCPGR